MRAIRRLTVRPVLPAELAALEELAFNLRWSWHYPTQELFRACAPDTWEVVGQDPVRLLGELTPERLDQLIRDEDFRGRLDAADRELRDYLTGDRWYQRLGAEAPRQIAYFSPEFGLTAALPQYSGGLGILAGDHLKTASDLGVPMLGVGLLYRRGYFRQSLSPDGWQQERYPVADPDAMPLTLLREPDGSVTKVVVELPGDPGGARGLAAQIWVAQVGRVPLLLLDSAVEENAPPEREVTDRLYGGSSEHRLLQEMLLGIGGVRALRAYCRLSGADTPEVFHTNEGHAGFLGLERIREYVVEHGVEFDAAVEITRSGTVFTTHTPVPAGIDRFGRDQVAQHFAAWADSCRSADSDAAVGPTLERLLDLGAETYEGGDPGVFNMAVMGLRLAQRANGVSRLHGEVSRRMFSGLWPGFDPTDTPISAVTNGVHAATWVAPEMARLVEREGLTGPDPGEEEWSEAAKLSDTGLWQTRRSLRERLVTEARRRLRESAAARGASEAELAWTETALDPDVLTIGFARRVPSYKRLTLMLRDPDRLARLLTHPERPIQLVIAGKAHPADEAGKRLIQQMVWFSDRPDVRDRIVFLPDYDMGLSAPLVAGCDVWLNNPLRPYEACGTSGMKAALNGGLNVSIRDGWWDEWYDAEFGWAIPSAEGVADEARRDDLEAAALYGLLEERVAPRFYERDPGGVPRRWLEMVRHTLMCLGPKVLAERMLGDYVRELYTPATRVSRALDSSFEGARELAAWKRRVHGAWAGVHIDHVESAQVGRRGAPDTAGHGGHGTGRGAELGGAVRVRVYVSLGELGPDDVEVQALHGRVDDSDQLHAPTTVALEQVETYEHQRYCYQGTITLEWPGPFGYTVRIVPRHAGLVTPSEMGLATWPAGGHTD